MFLGYLRKSLVARAETLRLASRRSPVASRQSLGQSPCVYPGPYICHHTTSISISKIPCKCMYYQMIRVSYALFTSSSTFVQPHSCRDFRYVLSTGVCRRVGAVLTKPKEKHEKFCKTISTVNKK